MTAQKDGWQPMETAPQDGSLFVIFHRRWKTFRIVKWHEEDRFGVKGWAHPKDCDGFILRVGQTTHFVWSGQTLPLPPEGI